MISRRRFIAITAAAALAPKPVLAALQKTRWSGVALGAKATLTIAGIDSGSAQRLIDEAVSEIERQEAIFSLYRIDSALAQLNRQGRLTAPPPDLLRLLSQADAIHYGTGGAFDPTVQPLWAFHAENRGRPSDDDVTKMGKRTGWRHVRIGADEISFAVPEMAMTLNGIAQGYVTDRIADLLRQAGLENVLVSIGEISAIGEREPGKPWRVGLSETGDGAVEEELALSDVALATSSPSGTAFDPGGKFGHILDPRTGRPGSHWRRISVLNPSAALADGLSTGMAVMERAEIVVALSRFADTQVIAIDHEGKRFTA